VTVQSSNVELSRSSRTPRSAQRAVCFFVIAVIGAILFVGDAGAGTLDQSSTAGNNRSNYLGVPAWVVGQTFTAGTSGMLDQVDLLMNWTGSTPPDGPIRVDIESATGNLPSGTILATATIPASDVTFSVGNSAWWVTATFGLPAAVNAGTQYAIVLSSTSTVAALQTFADLSAGYPGGQLSRQPSSGGAFTAITPAADLNFRTYVAPVVASLPRGAYCAPKPVRRADGTVGTFLDLTAGQPDADPSYAGAVHAWFGERYGLTCDALTGKGFKDSGYKVDGSGVHTGNPAADVYDYFLKP
jgi:hypothetical protein